MGARRCLEQKTRSWEFWKLGGLDKHCAEDLREQAERSATSSTLAVVQAACNTMTPVAPGLQQSSEANAVVAAINGALAPRLGGIQGPMGMLAGQMTSLKCNVVQLSAQAQHHDQGTSECERQLKDTTAGRSTGSGAASSAASSETHPELARGLAPCIPKNQSTVPLVGGFAHDTERDVICDKLREIFGQEQGVKDWWTPGKVGSVGKVSFHTNDHAWTFLREYKGRKFSHGSKQLRHTWDRPKEEGLLSKRVSLAIRALRIRVVERSFLELVYTGELIQGWDEDFALCGQRRWMRQISGSRRYRRRLRGARLYLLSWNVACTPAGPPLTKSGACSKPAKAFAKFLRDVGRDHCWSILCMQEVTSSNGELVTETTEGLAIVVAAEITKCIVHGSFCVQVRSCAVDVCWEGKKLRVICSHLNPGSVMHMYARDLEDLRMLVTSRWKDAHVHTCVDVQTGLDLVQGYLVPPAVTLAPQLLHIVSKNRDHSSASSWNVC